MSPSNSSPRRRVDPAPGWNIFLYLVAFRLVNALTVRTFFQPDEFFQSLEPAWQIAFGKDQGAWLTWVSGQLRVARQHTHDVFTRNGDTNYDPHYTLYSSLQSTR